MDRFNQNFDGLMPLLALPALLKAIAFLLVWLILWLPLGLPVAMKLNWRPSEPLEVKQKLPLLASLYLLAPLIVWGTSWVEGVPLTDYGLRWEAGFLLSIGLGFGLGVLGLAVVFGTEGLLGWMKWHWHSESESTATEKQPRDLATLAIAILLPTLLIALLISGIEELVFRGLLLSELQQDYSVWVAAAISSLIFALLHLVWEQQETRPQLPGLWLMGMVLVLARIVNGGSLGLAIGLHAGWIWGIASLDTAQLIAYTGKVPAWITGLAGKPLAGLSGIVCLVGTAIALWWFAF